MGYIFLLPLLHRHGYQEVIVVLVYFILIPVCPHPVLLPLFLSVEDQVSSLVERIQSSSTSFLISDSIIFDETSNASIRATLPEISKAAARQHSHTEHMAHTHGRPVTINLLESTQQSSDTPSAPFLQVGPPLASGCVRMTMPIDVLGLVEWESTLGQLASGLKERICAQIDALKAEILWEVWSLIIRWI